MRIVKVRGTNEPLTRNMLAPIGGEELPYRAEIAPVGTQTYGQSVSEIRARLRDIDRAGEDYVLVAYSLGAAGAGDFVAFDRPQHCRGFIGVADPKRHRAQCANAGAGQARFGIAGERWVPGMVWQFAVPDDPITAIDADNGVRAIAAAVTGLPQRPTPGWLNAGAVVSAVWRYAQSTPPSRHCVYGIEPMPGDSRTYVQAAADIINNYR